MTHKTAIVIPMLLISAAAFAENVDFDSIRFWAGEGENRAALLVQFYQQPDYMPVTYVWGYRWPASADATGETMLREIAEASPDLTILTQYTGGMGCTLCGIGYSENNSVINDIYFDFGAALSDDNINFGYMTPNDFFGQTKAPAGESPAIAQAAIEAAAATHVIEHPFNQKEYGYPAYDYDHWVRKSSAQYNGNIWQSGWYTGYWSFWTGPADNLANLAYSGAGMTSSTIADGSVNAWAFQPLDGVVGGDYHPEDVQWQNLDYIHFGDYLSSLQPVGLPDTDNSAAPYEIFTISGTCIATVQTPEDISLPPGIYIMRHSGRTTKILFPLQK